MRLTDIEVAEIKRSAQEAFGLDVVVRLFGSRLDNARRGGDIDLHVQLPDTDRSHDASARFRRLLSERVGEREYDILVTAIGGPTSAIDRKALAEGVIL